MIVRLAAATIALTLAAGAAAQQGNTMIYLPAPSASAAASRSVLRAGTEVPLSLSGSAKNRKFTVGQRVPLTVASDVRFGSTVVIPAGATAEGEVTALQGGDVAAKALSVRVGDKTVRLTGTFGGRGARAFLGEDVTLGD